MAHYHESREGDCISSIAFENGFAPDTVWNHPNNAEIRRQRKDPNVLMPGDRVFVPDKRLKEVSETTGQVYKYTFKGVPAKLNLQLMYDGYPIRSKPFTLIVDGAVIQGTTDGEGRLRTAIQPNARSGKISFHTEEGLVEFGLDLGGLAPIEEVSGVKKRLQNLGYDTGDLSDEMTEELESAIAAFEYDNGLKQSGKLTETIRAKVKSAHGW